MFGRYKIYTDEPVITSDNVLNVLQNAYITHLNNSSRIDFLLEYEAGNQPIQRTKTFRSDINCNDIDNVANEITEFKLGFKWGNPITFVQRGEGDSGKGKDEPIAVSLLNEQYSAAGIEGKTQELARYVEICGLGYVFVDIKTEWEEGDPYFTIDVLDPRNTFIVHSSYYTDKRPMLGVTYRTDDTGNIYFTCFTSKERFEIHSNKITNGKSKKTKEEWGHENRSGESNPLGVIPIIEWIRSYDGMGCFERQIDDMDALNILESDMVNASSEQVDCIWHTNDVEFPKDEQGNVIHPESNDWLQTFTTRDGKTPFVTPLSPNYDYAGNMNNIITKRALILQKCNVPQRNDNSGGSTGIAMSDASGWSAAESAACKDENIMVNCKMNELKAVLRAIKLSPNIKPDNPLLTLLYTDVKPNIKRQKTYEMTTKANAFATWLSHGVDGLHALKAVNAFDDPNQVWEDSKELIKKYQKSIFEKPTTNNAVGGEGEQKPNADRIQQDESDQVENSPNLKG